MNQAPAEFPPRLELVRHCIGLERYDQADYYNNLAMLHRKRGDHTAALRVFDEGLSQHPDSRLLQMNRQTTLEERKRRSK